MLKDLEMGGEVLLKALKLVGGSKEWNAYQTKGVYTEEELPLDFVRWHVENDHSFELDGEVVNVSQNLLLFTTTSTNCPVCGLEGSFWALQRSGNKPYHLNLWGLDEQGRPRLFTKDHVVPRSRGGCNEMHNYQTMCMRCNNKKGNNENYYKKGNKEV